MSSKDNDDDGATTFTITAVCPFESKNHPTHFHGLASNSASNVSLTSLSSTSYLSPPPTPTPSLATPTTPLNASSPLTHEHAHAHRSDAPSTSPSLSSSSSDATADFSTPALRSCDQNEIERESATTLNFIEEDEAETLEDEQAPSSTSYNRNSLLYLPPIEEPNLPWHFSWIDDGMIGGSSAPVERIHWASLHRLNVGLVVNLTEGAIHPPNITAEDEENFRRNFSGEWDTEKLRLALPWLGLSSDRPPICSDCGFYDDTYDADLFDDIPATNPLPVLFLPIPDGSIPGFPAIKLFLRHARETIARNQKVIVHCQAGVGRTGIFLAIFLMEKYNIGPLEALQMLRAVRPQSLQFRAVDWHKEPFEEWGDGGYQRNLVQERFLERYWDWFLREKGQGGVPYEDEDDDLWDRTDGTRIIVWRRGWRPSSVGSFKSLTTESPTGTLSRTASFTNSSLLIPRSMSTLSSSAPSHSLSPYNYTSTMDANTVDRVVEEDDDINAVVKELALRRRPPSGFGWGESMLTTVDAQVEVRVARANRIKKGKAKSMVRKSMMETFCSENDVTLSSSVGSCGTLAGDDFQAKSHDAETDDCGTEAEEDVTVIDIPVKLHADDGMPPRRSSEETLAAPPSDEDVHEGAIWIVKKTSSLSIDQPSKRVMDDEGTMMMMAQEEGNDLDLCHACRGIESVGPVGVFRGCIWPRA
ncbi:cell division control protein 14 [Phlyctochytrium planicorne]|nr:cell division control protein 14 [Phlyctochytrium planicorne]